MNCHDARERFSALLAGELGLTAEWAETEAHVRGCIECLQILEQLYQLRLPQHAGRHRAPMSFAAEPSPPADVVIHSRRRLPLSTLRGLAVSAVTLMLVTGLAVYVLHRGSALQFAAHLDAPAPTEPIPLLSPAETPSATQPDASRLVGPSPPAVGRSGEPPVTRSLPTVPMPRAEQPAPQGRNDEQEFFTRIRNILNQAFGNPTENSPAPAAASRPLPAPGVGATITPERSEPPSSKDVATAPPARPEPATASASPARVSSSDVVVRLSVQDRREAERDVTTLLSRVGGTKLGRNKGFTLSVVVPRSSFAEFTRGLAQIGSWQMETEHSSLPDPVRMVVRLAR